MYQCKRLCRQKTRVSSLVKARQGRAVEWRDGDCLQKIELKKEAVELLFMKGRRRECFGVEAEELAGGMGKLGGEGRQGRLRGEEVDPCRVGEASFVWDEPCAMRERGKSAATAATNDTRGLVVRQVAPRCSAYSANCSAFVADDEEQHASNLLGFNLAL